MIRHASPDTKAAVTLIGTLLFGLCLARLQSHLLFHTLVELFTIAVEWSVFFLAWNSRRFVRQHYLLLIGIASLFVGVVDVFHTLAYQGMNVLPGGGANLASQLWIAGRWVQALSFLAAPLFFRRQLNPYLAVGINGAITVALLAAILRTPAFFPACFIEGQGLTSFKIGSEYAVVALLAASAVMLFREQRELDPVVLRQMAAAIFLTISAGLAFTLYEDVYGFMNVAGHLLRFVASCLIYRAIIVTGLERPWDLLFRDLAQSEEALRRANEALRQSDERYRAFVANSSEGICRVEASPPVPLDLPEDERLRLLLERACVAESNDVFARMTGGRPLPDGDLLWSFVRSGCRRAEGEVCERAGDGTPRWAEESLTGVVESGRLLRVWRVRRDVTERKRAAAERERLIDELRKALGEVKTLSGLLPICANCKKIRDDGGYWTQVESYLLQKADVSFTHGICPDCMKELYPDF